MYQKDNLNAPIGLHVSHWVCNVSDMDRRLATPNTPAVLAAVFADTGVTAPSVSEATGIPLSRLDPIADLSMDELGKVGGFFRVNPAIFFAGVPA